MASLRERALATIDKYKHGVLLLYFLFYLAWFRYLERSVTTHFHVVHMALDDYIPFCEYFVVPYMLWFAFVAWGVLYFFFKDKEEYFRLCATLFSGMTIFLVVSTIYPNGHYLRPEAFARDNVFVDIVKALYQSDTATNLFPSIHVYNSLAICAAVWHYGGFKHKWAMRCGSAVLTVSIILSTMFLKQHSVFDVITGIALAVAICTLVYSAESFRLPAKAKGYGRNAIRRLG